MDEGLGNKLPLEHDTTTNRAGSQFQDLYESYFTDLKFFIVRYVHCDSIAEDLAQDIFLKIWCKRDELAHVLDLKAYLFKMARNRTLDYLKKIKRVDLMPDEMIKEFKNFDKPLEATITEKEYFFFLKEQLNKLPERSQQIFHLCREMQKSYDEVSIELNISKNTVKHHMVFTMKWLRKEVINKLNISDGLRIVILLFIDKNLP